MNSYQYLVEKLDQFISKYYKDLLIRGLILYFIVFSVLILFVSVLEFFGWFSSNWRFFIFTFSISVSFLFLGYFVLIPLLRFLKIGRRLTYQHAALIIQKSFPDIKDQLINILELKDSKSEVFSNELILASIDQKINNLERFDFTKSINRKSVLKLAKYGFLLLIANFCIAFIKPEIFTKGTTRIIHYKKQYNRELGFDIVIDTAKLFIERGSDLKLEINLVGSNFPEELFINYGGGNYLLEKQKVNQFVYFFKHINNEFKFVIRNDFFSSQEYNIQVYSTPLIKQYFVEIEQPQYIGGEQSTISNFVDLIVPQGSKLNFNFKCEGVDKLMIKLDSQQVMMKKSEDIFDFSLVATNSTSLSFSLINQYTNKDFLSNTRINVIPDFYPEIELVQDVDNSDLSNLIFKGLIKDDYGFTTLRFICSGEQTDTVTIKINNKINIQEFFYQYQFKTNASLEEKIITYYFEIFDNDALNGPKSTKTQIYNYKVPSLSNLIDQKQAVADNMFKKLEESSFIVKDIQNDLEELKRKLLNNNMSDWEKEKTINQINEKKTSLESLLKEIINDNNQRNKLSNNFEQKSDDLLEKQKMIDDLLNSVMDEEFKKMMEEIALLKENLDKGDLTKVAEELKFKMEDLEKEVDRNLELLKKLKIGEDINKIVEDLKYLADEHEKINNLSDIMPRDSIVSTNENQQNFLNELKESYKNILEENNSLNNPEKLDEFNNEFDEIKEDFDKSREDILNDDKNSLEKRSKENSKKMRELADKMKNMIDDNSSKEEGENAETLRQVLDNLIEFSFSQEQIIDKYASIDNNNPGFINYQLEERNLLENFKIIKDSLYELSKRTAYLGNLINNSVYAVEDNITNSLESLKERNKFKALQDQRIAFKAANDLILLLSESLKNMENASSGGGGGKQKSKKQKPSKSEPSLSDLRKSQENLKKQMKDLLNQMKSDGKGKGGQKQQEGLAKMLMQNEIYQQMLNDLLSNSSVGKEASRMLEEIKKMMEDNNKDIVRNKLSNETFLRQQNIVTRLLEAEKAEQERDQEERRESKEAENVNKISPNKFLMKEVQYGNFNDLLQNNSLKLNYFYKNKYQEYLKNINTAKP